MFRCWIGCVLAGKFETGPRCGRASGHIAESNDSRRTITDRGDQRVDGGEQVNDEQPVNGGRQVNGSHLKWTTHERMGEFEEPVPCLGASFRCDVFQ